MFRDAANLTTGTTLRADVCIVGAGAAGITIARDLRASGLRVLLLESGDLEPESPSDVLNRGTASGVPEGNPTLCRARGFGGTTRVWAGWCRPLNPEDFQKRDWLYLSGWPLSYEEMISYYARAQDTCELGALEYDSETIAGRSSHDLLPLSPGRAETVLYQYSPPTRFGEVYRSDLEDDPRIEVYLNANLVNILLTENGAAVRRLECATFWGGRFAAEADRFVLAMGGLEVPRMLLASNQQESAGVGNARDQVGRYFQEHPHFGEGAFLLIRQPARVGSYLTRDSVSTVDPRLDLSRPARVGLALALPAEVRAREGLMGLAATLRLDDLGRDLTGPVEGLDVAALMEGTGNFGLYRLIVRAEQRPYARNRVTLGNRRDPLGVPRLHLHWELTPEDLESVRRSLEILGAEVGRNGGRLWVPQDRAGHYGPDTYHGGCHHMGTTRMSESPAEGVVDADGRVHGLANLFIAGSSVFPTGGFANPLLTIVALAHRLADHLRVTA